MSSVVIFRPKSLVEFEENALNFLSRLAHFFVMSETMYNIAGNDERARAGLEVIRELGEAINASIEVLSHNAERVSFMNEVFDGIRISVQSDRYPWRAIFTVSARCNIVWVRKIAFEPTNKDASEIPIQLLHFSA